MRRFLTIIITHSFALAAGFGLGVYFLPILTAPPSPDATTLEAMSQNALYTAEFAPDLRGEDFLHWGKGQVSITQTQIIHEGTLAPGPDYMVYLVPQFVTHEDEFLPLKDQSHVIGPVKTFEGFALDLPEGIHLEDYTTVLVWCEAFSEFIAAAKVSLMVFNSGAGIANRTQARQHPWPRFAERQGRRRRRPIARRKARGPK